jgi:hypothetical protein
MSDYLASQKTVSASFEASLEALTPDIEKVQFNDSGTLLLSRPDKIRATGTGGYADVELLFDGKVATVLPASWSSPATAVGRAPEYTLVTMDWKTGVPADDAAFAFNAPKRLLEGRPGCPGEYRLASEGRAMNGGVG